MADAASSPVAEPAPSSPEKATSPVAATPEAIADDDAPAATPEALASDPVAPADDDDKDDDNDDEEEEEEMLSDVDEDFEDYDPATAQIEERPVTIDEEAARGLKATKRKRTGDDKTRKPKEGRREKKRQPAAGDSDGDGEAGASSARPRRARAEGASAPRRKKSATPEVNEEDLTPEERRKRALNRAIDLAMRNPNKRRRKRDEDDLEKMADDEIAALKVLMENACMDDIKARTEGRPAVNKLQLLPQVLSVLNRNDIQETILDPETNFLQSVKFFLEPLNDGSLPSYAIQRDIFNCLTQLPIEKDALLSSGIGKVVFFYTLSKRAEPAIKRMAERLVGEWSRPILKKTDDFKKRHIETRDYDYRAARLAEQKGALGMSGSQYTQTLTERPLSRFELDRELQLAPPVVNANRATPVGLPQSYTVAPKSTFDGHRGADYRPIGASSVAAFQRMAQRAKMRNKKK
ncbi:Transcription factor iws1 [Sporothrix curviconia]|uniref:Transcription factor iws1 n=1 Tax=Sporothrix curviconia TaxID=1260050 RepID=A0ABP0CT95_9PEZI